MNKGWSHKFYQTYCPQTYYEIMVTKFPKNPENEHCGKIISDKCRSGTTIKLQTSVMLPDSLVNMESDDLLLADNRRTNGIHQSEESTFSLQTIISNFDADLIIKICL